MNRFGPRSALLVLALTLAGCGGASKGGGAPESAGSRPAEASGWVGRERVGDAIALLNRGEADDARRVLHRVLTKTPGDPVARSLIRQIDTPPETLLGTRHFAYTTRADDSMSVLAARFLGDPIMFYALARYNDIAAPGALEPGRTLRIPGTVRAQPKPAKPAPAQAEAAPAATAPVAPVVNGKRVAQLRAQGLEQLNRGAVDRAVVLLRQASRLDPANALVRRDLDRALRIRRTVGGHGS